MSKAAKELSVTQGAISRAIKILEVDLGTPVFHRTRPNLQLTEAGKILFSEVGYAFDRVAIAAMRIRESINLQPLIVNSLPTFAIRFLIPRLPRFQSMHPDIQVDLTVDEGVPDFAVESIDIAIRYGLGDWPGIGFCRLMDEELVLVCSPQLRESCGRNLTPGKLDPRRLLRHTTRLETWPEWFAAAGVAVPLEPKGLGLEHFIMVIEAAVAGMGFALLPRFLIEREIANGQLVIACLPSLRRQHGYHILYAPERRSERRITAFSRWLQQEVQGIGDAGTAADKR